MKASRPVAVTALLVTTLWLCLVPFVQAQHRSYIAAAAQYAVQGIPSVQSPLQIIQTNLDWFANFTAEAVDRYAQILVFPEGAIGYELAFLSSDVRLSLFQFAEPVPDVNNGEPYHMPCGHTQYGSQLRALSCLAQKYHIILVANMASYQLCDKQQDPDCPADGRYQFNTEVAFAENGQLLATYHKTHLYGESHGFDQPKVSAPKYFDASFGTRFGMLVCFDILFHMPSRQLLDSGIKDFVFSSQWVNGPPAQLAIQVQQAFSEIHGINLIAANSGLAPMVSGGGIYSQGKPLDVYFDPSATNVKELTVAVLPPLGKALDTPTALSMPRMRIPSDGEDTVHADQTDPMVATVQADLVDVLERNWRFQVHEESTVHLESNAVRDVDKCYLMDSTLSHCRFFDALPAAQGYVVLLQPPTSPVKCNISYQVSNTDTFASGKYPRYAVGYFQETGSAPHTIDPTALQSCMLVPCPNWPMCISEPFQAPLASFDYVHVEMIVNNTATIFPLVGAANGTLTYELPKYEVSPSPSAPGFNVVTMELHNTTSDGLFNAALYGVFDLSATA